MIYRHSRRRHHEVTTANVCEMASRRSRASMLSGHADVIVKLRTTMTGDAIWSFPIGKRIPKRAVYMAPSRTRPSPLSKDKSVAADVVMDIAVSANAWQRKSLADFIGHRGSHRPSAEMVSCVPHALKTARQKSRAEMATAYICTCPETKKAAETEFLLLFLLKN